MQGVLSLILIFFLIPAGLAQNKISGIVLDSSNNPVFAANVFLKHRITTATVTDFNGAFTMDVAVDDYQDTLVVTFIGYKSTELPLNTIVDSGTVRIVLQEESITLRGVTIRAEDPVSEQFSVVKLNKMDIYVNPVSNADPLKAITTLPASTTDDESANPSLRGSPAENSAVILNEVPVYNPVRYSQINGIGNFSLFNPDFSSALFHFS